MLLSISFKYSYFKPFFNYTRKGLWKGTIIYQNYDTLVCFFSLPKVHLCFFKPPFENQILHILDQRILPFLFVLFHSFMASFLKIYKRPSLICLTNGTFVHAKAMFNNFQIVLTPIYTTSISTTLQATYLSFLIPHFKPL